MTICQKNDEKEKRILNKMYFFTTDWTNFYKKGGAYMGKKFLK